MPNLNKNQKDEIIMRYKMGMPIRRIAIEMKINKSTVLLWTKKYKNQLPLEVKKGRWKKRKLNEEQEHLIIYLMRENKNFKMTDLKIELEKINIYASKNTLIKILKKYGYIYKNRIPKPFLSDDHKNIRLQFSLNNLETDWTKVIFSDEVTIIKDQNTGKFWIGKDDNGIIPTFKHPIKRNVWGCISIGGTETIYVFNNIMNADFYINILEDELLPIYDQKYIFQHDNDPKHTAIKTSLFLIDNDINVLLWPANSPDLNPIENIWTLLKNNLKKETINDDNFDDKIIKCWDMIKFEHVFNCICSMKNRIFDVINTNGGHINY